MEFRIFHYIWMEWFTNLSNRSKFFQNTKNVKLFVSFFSNYIDRPWKMYQIEETSVKLIRWNHCNSISCSVAYRIRTLISEKKTKAKLEENCQCFYIDIWRASYVFTLNDETISHHTSYDVRFEQYITRCLFCQCEVWSLF